MNPHRPFRSSPLARARRVALIGLAAALLGGCTVVLSPFGSGDDRLQETTVSGDGATKILWLPITGFISDAPAGRALGLMTQPSMLADIMQALDKAEQDEAIGALVLRIDSPGGTVAAADEIHARIKRYHETTGVPVIASFGGVAASGGYYVAMAANTIIAQPTSITGSIGVIMPGVNIVGLMDKLGIDNASYVSGANKQLLSPLENATPEQQRIVQRVVDSLYQRFVAVVRTGRPEMAADRIDTIADGRIVAAADARALGLIDTIGHLDDVIALARERAGVDQARVVRYYRGHSAPRTIVSSHALRDGGLSASARGVPTGLSIDQAALSQPLYLWQPGLLR